ncbi:MAG: PASTA domain-containing protein [Micromonosporaceae bacterium]|nr:PASTA domain-containing protein [Micromonosporaceae bacterium]
MSWLRPRDHNLFVNLGSLLLCGLVAGVVVAAAFFPGVALSGLMAKESLEQFDKLPSELIVDDGPQISYVLAADGETRLAAMYDENRRNVPLHDIAPVMIDAIISAEDRSFYEHNGVDVRGIARAFVANTAADEITQGASTITQQFVRLALTYFSDDLQDVVDATEDTTGRKLREARYAIAVEQQLTKDEILNRYLNLAYFGEGAYGIFAASQVYYGKRPADLELHEAAFLAGIVRSPSQYSPATDEGRRITTDRRDWVLDQMVDTQVITPAQAAEGKAIPLEVEPERLPNMCVGVATNHWGFFCDFFYRWWLEQEAFGATPWEREQRLRGGGFQIVTTLDLDVQESMKDNVEETLATGDERALMLSAVEPGTGKVRAMAANRRFALDDPDDPENGPHTDPARRADGVRGTYPNTTNPLLSGGGDIVGYQGGSTFKLFTAIAALEEGLPLSTRINAPTRVTTRFPVSSGPCAPRWCPQNVNPSYMNGVRDMWSGFGRSVNTYFAQLVERVGPEKAVNVAERLGIKFRASGTAENPQDAQFAEEPLSRSWGAFTLGVSSTTPLDLANAYATVAAEGVYCEPIPVEEIRTPGGDSLGVASPRCNRVLDEQVALAAADMARCPVGGDSPFNRCQPNGTAEVASEIIGKPIIGKSGTSEGERSALLVVSSKQITVAGILADPDWAETTQRMKHDFVNPAVIDTVRDAMEGVDGSDWARPTDRDLIRSESAGIPNVECQTVAEAERRLEEAGFDVRIDDDPVDSDCPAGRVADTSPSGDGFEGDTVTIRISNGSGDDGGGDDGGGDDDDDSGPGRPGEPTIGPGPPPGDED